MTAVVSLVVPVYLVEQYLRKCVDSILSQSYRDIEVILVDDGSPDNCGAICDSYARADDRVLVIHQQNQGLSVARNIGVENSTGKYVGFIDSDDWVHRDCIRILVELAETFQASVSTCRNRSVTGETTEDTHTSGAILVQSGFEAVKDLVEGRRREFGRLEIACAKLFDRRLFDHITFPAGRLHEDEFTTYKLILAAQKIVRTDSELYMYRRRPGSITASNRSFRSRADAIDGFLERREILKCNDLEYDDRSERSQLFSMFMQANDAHMRMLADERTASSLRIRELATKLSRIPQSPLTRLTFASARICPGAVARVHALVVGLFRLRSRVKGKLVALARMCTHAFKWPRLLRRQSESSGHWNRAHK